MILISECKFTIIQLEEYSCVVAMETCLNLVGMHFINSECFFNTSMWKLSHLVINYKITVNTVCALTAAQYTEIILV